MTNILDEMQKNSKIYVAGHKGLVGSAVMQTLEREGFDNIATIESYKVDLTRQKQVESYFREISPEYVFMCAAKVGGILANATYPADFIYKNLLIETHVIHEAFKSNVKRLLFLGSSCIYPKVCPQPIKEEYLLSGSLETTNQSYALAKIAGIELCRSYNIQYGTKFLAVMPCNLYGPNDNFNLDTSHVLPALVRKICEAKSEVVIWGSGKPRREFLYSEDLSEALLFLMELDKVRFEQLLNQHYPLINIGTGIDISIRELAELIADVAEFKGKFIYDTTKPDGTFQKVLDVTHVTKLGWKPKVSLREGIERMVHAYRLSAHR